MKSLSTVCFDIKKFLENFQNNFDKNYQEIINPNNTEISQYYEDIIQNGIIENSNQIIKENANKIIEKQENYNPEIAFKLLNSLYIMNVMITILNPSKERNQKFHIILNNYLSNIDEILLDILIENISNDFIKQKFSI
jgi:hypothetical protein